MKQAVINTGIVHPLAVLLHTAEFDIKKEAAWAISNATSGGTSEQIKYAFKHYHTVIFIVTLLATEQGPHAVDSYMLFCHN
jgi:Armadillo/beta-catenin-like repeat